MQRVLEPELMEDAEQVTAYANANFEDPHSDFIKRLQIVAANPSFKGHALDLGCGPGDITRRFAKAFPLCKIDAVDGSNTMITYAINSLNPLLKQRIHFIHGKLPHIVLLKSTYGIIFSNSLLHHLPDPHILWQTINQFAKAGTTIIVMDLIRPETLEIAKDMITTYAINEPEILQRDFYNSLLAAFTVDEIKAQLIEAELPLTVEQISDRHVFISGTL
jgi:ubiquinone/menaquinone biosynthesis C-methylase UbiE